MAIQMPQKENAELRPPSGSGDAATVGLSHENREMSSNVKNQALLQVLGVAMIVEERGAGARLVARYPTHPSAEENSAINSSATRLGNKNHKTSYHGSIGRIANADELHDLKFFISKADRTIFSEMIIPGGADFLYQA